VSAVPAEFVFTPNWWFRNYGVAFAEPFYFDREARLRHDVTMRRALYERFGLGEPDPRPRPIVGSEHVAGGFVVPAVLGCEIRFCDFDAPQPVARNLPAAEVRNLAVPDWRSLWPMREWIADMDALEREYGSVCGDFDLDGVLNTALQIRGQDLYLDLFDDPETAHHLFGVITELQIELARYVRSRTGTCGLSCNRSIANVDRRIFLHSNCSVQMVKPAAYEEFLLPCELRLAEALAPYGIHHCGNNLQRFARAYAKAAPVFVDVGWGSDVRECRRDLPGAFLNLRLSPVSLLRQSAAEVRRDAERLLEEAGGNAGLCCINMDYGTPDENVRAILEVSRT
jgi:hypothetical protein